ncbi:MAG TPA: ABC transporter permease [Chloroflexota bacterium]|nr:ABC transporter permease [Chloroflexota bacterium]
MSTSSEIQTTRDDVLLPQVASTAALQESPGRSRALPFERLVSICSPLILLLVWEVAGQSRLIDTRFFPTPSTIILRATIPMIQSGELWTHLSISLARIAVGFLIGAVPGVVIGLAMGLNPLVRAAIQPLVDATFPIPKSAIAPLFLMIFGIGEESKYAIIATAVIYLVLINTVSGVRNIESIYLDVGRNFGAGRLMMFTDIALPGALPMIFTGLKLGMGVALIIIVIAEILGAKSGIGFLIWNSWQVFQVEKMYTGLMVSAVLGFGSAAVLNIVERRLIPWKSG